MKITLNEKTKTKVQERFSHLLRSYRHANGLTQTDLANRLGVTMPLITKLEGKEPNNRAVSSYEFFKVMGDIVGVSYMEMASLLDNEGADLKNSPRSKSVNSAMKDLGPELECRFLAYLRETKGERLREDIALFLEVLPSLKTKEKRKSFLAMVHLIKKKG